MLKNMNYIKEVEELNKSGTRDERRKNSATPTRKRAFGSFIDTPNNNDISEILGISKVNKDDSINGNF